MTFFPTADRGAPFAVDYFAQLDTATGPSAGFNLEYTQVPC